MLFEGMIEWSVTLGKLLEGVLTVSSKGSRNLKETMRWNVCMSEFA